MALPKSVEDHKKVDLEIEHEKDKCKDSCPRFIRKWVYIEDKDQATVEGGGIAVKFKLWPGQLKVLAAILSNRLLVILKARQLGLTWLALSYAVWRMVFSPGYTVAALSKTERDAKELTRRIEFILRHLPAWMAQEKRRDVKPGRYVLWESTTETVTLYHPDSTEPSGFKSLTSAPGSGRSFTENLIILDEWAFQQWAEEIWASVYPTVNRPTGGQVIGLSTNKRGSLFEATWINAVKGLNSFARMFLPWWTDPRRTKEWYEQTKKDLPHSWMQEYPATPEEALSAGEGTAFPEFSEMIHVCRPFKIPPWWRRWRGNDPGYADPFAWYWLAVSDDGIVYIYREFSRDEKDPRLTYEEQAKEVVRRSVMGGEYGLPETDEFGKEISEQISFTVVGRDAWNKLGRGIGVSEGKSIVDCYQAGGLSGCIPPPTDQRTARISRKAILHEYLKPLEDERTGKTIARVQIFNTCAKLIEALPNLIVDEKDSEKVAEEPHVYTNPFDAAGYGLVAWHSKHSKKPEAEKTQIQKDKEKLAKRFNRPAARRRFT
jgi:hypothetical protein